MREHLELEKVAARSYTVPTDEVESDGTLVWDSTTIVIVETEGGGCTGLGYSYTHKSAAQLINDTLAGLISGLNVLDTADLWRRMVEGCRNYGDSSLVMMAIAAVDSSLWDLKARIFDRPLLSLLGGARQSVPVYGSGGFTSYDLAELQQQLHGWQEQGIDKMKIKIGRRPSEDPERIRAARQAIGEEASLFVDANGAYAVKQALFMGDVLAEYGVSWYEEPVYHRDHEGLHYLRQNCPPGIEIAAGEYGFNLDYFRRMLAAKCLDVLQADASRCSLSVFLQVADLCQARYLPFSSHTAPALHCHACCAVLPVRHMEYFHDHVRLEKIFFDGLPDLRDGRLHPNLDRPGMGLVLKRKDIGRYAD